jgi:gamma-glutamyltranspeptidase/glutathione hydrolase
MTSEPKRGWPWLGAHEPHPRLSGFRPVISSNGMVSSPHHLASQVGLDVLRRGGNAVDAAVATSAALMVACPMQCGPGGDAIWLIREPGGATRMLDASGRAPAAASAEALRAAGMEAIAKRSGHAVTVPGAIAGWAEALQRYGSRPLADLLKAPTALASDGFLVSRHLATSFAVAEEELREKGALALFSRDSRTPPVLSRLRQPALASAFREIGRTNGRSLYEGPLARAIVDAARKHGSPLSPDDLLKHKAEWLEPIRAPFRDIEVLTSRPSTQGFALIIALRLIEMLAPGRLAVGTPEAVHLMIEAVAAALYERDMFLADRHMMRPDVPGHWSAERIATLAGRFDSGRAGVREVPRSLGATKGDTAHLAVVDSKGLAVSLIQSLFFDFGTCIPVPEGGFTLQNRGAGFSLVKGVPSELGPGRRPPHTLVPTIAVRRGELAFVLGCMGGDGQVQTQVQLILDMVDGRLDPQQAISRPRWYLDRSGLPRAPLAVESGIDPLILEGLRARGHEIEALGASEDIMGHAQAIAVMGEGERALVGAADPRSDGQVAAF